MFGAYSVEEICRRFDFFRWVGVFSCRRHQDVLGRTSSARSISTTKPSRTRSCGDETRRRTGFLSFEIHIRTCFAGTSLKMRVFFCLVFNTFFHSVQLIPSAVFSRLCFFLLHSCACNSRGSGCLTDGPDWSSGVLQRKESAKNGRIGVFGRLFTLDA